MTALVVLPLWQVLLGVLGIAALVGVPSAYFGAKYGAKLAVELCAQQMGCEMRIEKERKQDTQNLEEQLRALHSRHPELKAARAAADRILRETGENPAMPEPKPGHQLDTTGIHHVPPEDRRAQQDKDRDGHK